MENALFEGYLESLGIPDGARIGHRAAVIAAMYRTGVILSSGWVPPVFPIVRLKVGWIGWLAEEADLQGSEGWPASSLATRLQARTGPRQHVESVEATASNGFDYVAALLRFGRRWTGDERAALVRGFAQAVGLAPEKEAWTLEFLAFCEDVFLRTVRAAQDDPRGRWRRLARELGL